MILNYNPSPELYLGLDLGKLRDYTVLAILERRFQQCEWNAVQYAHPRRPVLILRDLVRLPLNTPYTKVPSLIRDGLMRYQSVSGRITGSRTLIVDAGGVGGAVMDIIRRTQIPNLRLVAITTTGGNDPRCARSGSYNVPRRDLLTALKGTVEAKSLLIPRTLPLAQNLFDELAALRTKGKAPGKHNDLVMATALAIYWAVQRNKALLG